ncbi:MAG: RHS repeat-associated core domain-containing protein, partial [Vicingaceae bacterium]
TGWDAFELRMYDGRMARWMSDDPYRQYHSPYVSMGNNPVSMVDPDGGFNWLGAGIGAIGGGLAGGFISQNNGGSFAVGFAAGFIGGGLIGGIGGQIIENVSKNQRTFDNLFSSNKGLTLGPKIEKQFGFMATGEAWRKMSYLGKEAAYSFPLLAPYARGAYYIYNAGNKPMTIRIADDDNDIVFQVQVPARSGSGRYYEYGPDFGNWLDQKRANGGNPAGANLNVTITGSPNSVNNVYLIESGGVQTVRPVSRSYGKKVLRRRRPFRPVGGIRP